MFLKSSRCCSPKKQTHLKFTVVAALNIITVIIPNLCLKYFWQQNWSNDGKFKKLILKSLICHQWHRTASPSASRVT